MTTMVRRDARFTAGPYIGKYLVAEQDDTGSIIALICEGHAGSLSTVADFWFSDAEDLALGVTGDGWDVEWLAPGSLGDAS